MVFFVRGQLVVQNTPSCCVYESVPHRLFILKVKVLVMGYSKYSTLTLLTTVKTV